MPNVVGMTAPDADALLAQRGFTNVTYQSSGSALQPVPGWTVTAQSVPAGTQVDPSTPIVLTCTESANGRG
jgi:beta-lactam-binding protein with PASTA domain